MRQIESAWDRRITAVVVDEPISKGYSRWLNEIGFKTRVAPVEELKEELDIDSGRKLPDLVLFPSANEADVSSLHSVNRHLTYFSIIRTEKDAVPVLNAGSDYCVVTPTMREFRAMVRNAVGPERSAMLSAHLAEPEELSETEEQVLNLIRNHPGLTSGELSEELQRKLS